MGIDSEGVTDDVGVEEEVETVEDGTSEVEGVETSETEEVAMDDDDDGVATGVLVEPAGVDGPGVAGELVLTRTRGDEDVGVKEGSGTVTTEVNSLLVETEVNNPFVETEVNSVLTLVNILLAPKLEV